MISIVKSYEWNGWTAIRYELEVKEYAVMELEIQMYTKDRIPDVLDFEKRLRKEEDKLFWRIEESVSWLDLCH